MNPITENTKAQTIEFLPIATHPTATRVVLSNCFTKKGKQPDFRLCREFWPTTNGRPQTESASHEKIPAPYVQKHGPRIGRSILRKIELERKARDDARRC